MISNMSNQWPIPSFIKDCNPSTLNNKKRYLLISLESIAGALKTGDNHIDGVDICNGDDVDCPIEDVASTVLATSQQRTLAKVRLEVKLAKLCSEGLDVE
ncbi:hypothetical protein GJ496_004058 [Pomphorhynchus laevis]|nr:hypothetical protein GJ496_004058 [Pomphorhynchus laevis]